MVVYLCVLVSVCERERDSFFFLSFFFYFFSFLVWFGVFFLTGDVLATI